MVTTTTQYSFQKPTVGDDEDVWGGYLNSNFDSIDSLLRGSTALSTINVTGNITVGGTVDGRDVASDGTKLDGIEAGATADQTAAEIRSLVESATDSNVFTDADHTKLNGIEAGATADQTKADIDALGIAASTASTLATARNISLTGAVTGNANFDGSGNISIATTATSDPTLTLNGDASGSATFTNLGNATLTVTVADDSHNHVISNVDGLQTELDGKSPLANPDFTGVASFGDMITVGNSGTRLSGGTDLLEIYGNTASFHMGVQDGSGRVQMRWNASRGTNPTYQVSNEPSARFEIVDVTSPTDSLWKIDYAGNGTAGNTISYSNIMSLGTSTFTYNGNSVWHAGNDGSGSGLDADLLDGVQGSSYLRSDTTDTMSGRLEMGNVLDMNNYDIYGVDQIFHHGDTNTYMQFHASDQWRVVTGGAERLEVNNTRTQIDRLLVASALAENYSALSGTTPTCDPDTAGAFALTMTGNTTFTFGAPALGSISTGFILELTGNGSTVTWPSSVDWAGGTAPDAPASGETDIYVFWTRDGGTTWYGVQSIDAAA